MRAWSLANEEKSNNAAAASTRVREHRAVVHGNIDYDKRRHAFRHSRRNSDPLGRSSNDLNNPHQRHLRTTSSGGNYEFYSGTRPLLTSIRRPKLKEKSPFKCDIQALVALFHISIVVLVTTHVVINSRYEYAIARNAFYDWNQILFPPNLAPTDDIDQVVDVITQNQTITTLNQIAYTYFSTMYDDSVTHFVYILKDGKPEPMTLTVSLYEHAGTNTQPVSGPIQTNVYSVYSQDKLGPISNLTKHHERVQFFERLNSVSIEFNVRNIILTYTRICVQWNIRYTLSSGSRGHVYGNLYTHQSWCPASDENLHSSSPSVIVILDVFIIVFSFLSLFSSWMVAIIDDGYCRRRGRGHYNRVSSSPLSIQQPHTHIRCSTSFRSRRWLISQITDISNMIAAIFEVQSRLDYEMSLSNEYVQFFFAFGALLSWTRLILLVKYLGPRFYVFVKTMQDATPFLGRFLVGVLPVFIGFACFGVAVFSTTTRKFRDLDLSAMSLFAILNGDMLEASYHDLMYTHRALGQIYVYLVILLFMWIVSKLALAAVEFYFFMNVPAANIVEYEQSDDEDDENDENEKYSKRLEHLSLFFPQRNRNIDVDENTLWKRIITNLNISYATSFIAQVSAYIKHNDKIDVVMNDKHTKAQWCTSSSCTICKCGYVYREILNDIRKRLDILLHKCSDYT